MERSNHLLRRYHLLLRSHLWNQFKPQLHHSACGGGSLPPALRRINRPRSKRLYAILQHNPAESLSTNCLLVMSRDSVFACVASLCAVYHEGAELIHQIRADQNFCMTSQESPLGRSAQDLESSLERGESAVRNQYERIHKRCGEAFVRGDRTCLNYIYLKLADFYRFGQGGTARWDNSTSRRSHCESKKATGARHIIG